MFGGEGKSLMIAGIGMDMIEIERVKKACEKERFLTKCFTEAERALIEKDKKKAADNFAVKEAVAKALGTGFYQMLPTEIECLRDGLGKPYITLYGGAKDRAEKLLIERWYVTITNSRELSAAFVVAETD
jgi:holo-[acyl-carrier protein] synthase